MKVRIAAVIATFIFAITAGFVWAKPEIASVKFSQTGVEKAFSLPLNPDKAPILFLGNAVDPISKKKVEGYAVIHFKDKTVRSNKPVKGGKNQCYSFLGNGAKWKASEPWIINPNNTRSLPGDALLNILSSSVFDWEDASDGTLGNNLGKDILGEGSTTSASLNADSSSPDGQNEVYFADIPDQDAIAVTVVWGVFGGPPAQRELVEWDMIFDDVTFDWSIDEDLNKMDFKNIAIHELGHSAGLNDLYELVCGEETMYGYAQNGEIKKRDLNSGDIEGIKKLYQ